MKQLICAADIEHLSKAGQKVCVVKPDTIVTPSARDAAETFGVKIQEESCVCSTAAEGIDSEKIYAVLKYLMEKGLLSDLMDAKPYEAERHENGLKMIRGSSVRMENLDTGTPGVKARYQELVHKDESHVSAGFLEIDHSEFPWELTYEEIDYVIEGTLTVTIDGKTYTCKPGDVLFVPAGSKVIWGSPDQVRVFYATYPANWPDLV